MPAMLHQIQIKASAEKVYAAITTEPGLSGWWTGDTVAQPQVGTIAGFGFSNRATLFRMQIVELKPNRRVVWHCLGDIDEWAGTKLIWELSEIDNATELRFAHRQWRSTKAWFALCNTTWGALMYHLKEYAEGKSPGPLFKGHV